jgi:hypothetical protein
VEVRHQPILPQESWELPSRESVGKVTQE